MSATSAASFSDPAMRPGKGRAGGSLNVAQTSSLLYRGLPARRTSLGSPDAHSNSAPADWKSAIQQVGNLRYADAGECE